MSASDHQRLLSTREPRAFWDNSDSNVQPAVHVITTNWKGTRVALKAARQWARHMESRVVVWFLEMVPRQFALRRPPVSLEFAQRRLEKLIEEHCQDVNVELRMCLCTDMQRCLAINLELDSVVFVGGRARWWRGWEQKLARDLKTQGHLVLFVDSNEDHRTELMVAEKITA